MNSKMDNISKLDMSKVKVIFSDGRECFFYIGNTEDTVYTDVDLFNHPILSPKISVNSLSDDNGWDF